jgi:hypothetical protein|tara:strand:- start:445 stop:951 length:507 start_codon:yes stop_codon:yes gene_type:complete
MDEVSTEAINKIEAMKTRFLERAQAVSKSGMPPLEGVMRRKWVQQKEIDYQDFLMISDCAVEVIDGILTFSLDLRPAICDATMRQSPNGITDKTAEHETQVAMENIAQALPTDGNKITPKMLDSKADLQALIDGAEMFRTVEQIQPIVSNDPFIETIGTKKKLKKESG